MLCTNPAEAGDLFKQSVEHQKVIDKSRINQCVLRTYLSLGHSKDEQLNSTLQSIITDIEARKQKMGSLLWSIETTQVQKPHEALFAECEAFTHEIEDKYKKEGDDEHDEKEPSQKIVQMMKQAMLTLASLKDAYENESKTFAKTGYESKKVVDEYLLFAEQRTKNFALQQAELESNMNAKNVQWKTSQQIEWSERHHRFLSSLDQWIEDFRRYQVATIALISINKNTSSKTGTFRALAQEFEDLLPNRNSAYHSQQHSSRPTFVLSTMMMQGNESTMADEIEGRTEKICSIVSEWVSLVKPITEEIRSYRRGIRTKIQNLMDRIADMQAQEDLNTRMISKTAQQQQTYFDTISRATKLRDDARQTHRQIEQGLIELESVHRKNLEERRRLEQKLDRLERLIQNTNVPPPDDILKQLTEEENQLLLQKQMIHESVVRNEKGFHDHMKHQVDQFVQTTRDKIETDLASIVNGRDQLFGESLSRVNPENMGSKHIAAYLSTLEYAGKILAEDETKLSLFRFCAQALQSNFYTSCQKTIVALN